MTTNSDVAGVSTATYGIMLLVFVAIGRIQELVPYLDRIHFGKLVFALCLLLVFAGPRNKIKYLGKISQLKYVVGICICVLISIPFSYWQGGSLEFVVQTYSKTLLFFVLLIVAVKTIQEISKIIWALANSVLALSLTVLLSGGTGRLSASSTYDPNDLAFVLVTFMPLIYYFMKEKQGIGKIILQVTLIMMLLALTATASRGGFIGLIVIVFAILLKAGKKIFRLFFPLTVLAVILYLFAPTTFWDRMSSILHPQEDYNMSAGGGRIEIWKEGLTMMGRDPLTGVGINCYEVAEGEFHTDRATGNSGKWSSAHNSFIQIGAELGIIGLSLYILLLISSIRAIRACRQSNYQGKILDWFLDGTEVSIYGYISTGFFLSHAYSPVFYFLIALVIIIQQHDLDLKRTL